jgi:broad specificity phosphatase PhoE
MSKQMTTIYLVRHGESESNANKGKHYTFYEQWGELGAPLSEAGKQQASERAQRLKHIPFAAVFSSDFTRARQTAEIIALEHKLVVQTSNLIREREEHLYKMWLEKHGKSIEQYMKTMREELAALDDAGKMAYKYDEGMESAGEGASRLLTFLREIAVAYAGKTVLVVNHGNLMRSLLVHLGYAGFDELPTGTFENTGVIVLESDGVEFFIKSVEGVEKVDGQKRWW